MARHPEGKAVLVMTIVCMAAPGEQEVSALQVAPRVVAEIIHVCSMPTIKG